MIRSTCVKCNRELTCLKNNVPLVHFTNNDRMLGIDVVCFVDIWTCKICGAKVTMGHGDMLFGHDIKDGIKKFLKTYFDFVEVKW